MNKVKLIETVSKGSHVRKTVDPELVIGDASNGYVPGDILDANSVQEKVEDIQETIDGLDNVYAPKVENGYIENPDIDGVSGQILSLDSHGNTVWSNPTEGSITDSTMSDISENPVQNKTIKAYVDSTIYDISVNHPTSGVDDGNTYTSLSEALAVIPQDKQKGGMTVRYILSSDNKYVQARCMAQNFTTDTTQWQGVDKEPTAGSENLVKSGGVENFVSNGVNKNTFRLNALNEFPNETLKKTLHTKDLCKFTGVLLQDISGVLTKTATSDSDMRQSDFIPVTSLSYIESVGNNTTGIPPILCFSDSSFSSYVGCVYGETQVFGSWYSLKAYLSDINLPQNTNYIVIQYNNASALKSASYICEISYPKSNLLHPNEGLPKKILTSDYCKNVGGYRIENGAAVYHPELVDVYCSGLIHASLLQYVISNSSTNEAVPSILYFDKEMNYISCEYGTTKIASTWKKYDNIPTIPNSAIYAIVQINTNSLVYNEQEKWHILLGNAVAIDKICKTKGYFSIENNTPVYNESEDMFYSDKIDCSDIIEIDTVCNSTIPIVLYYNIQGEYIGCEYSNNAITIPITGSWFRGFLKTTPPSNAKYAIIQYNANLFTLGDNTYLSVYFKKQYLDVIKKIRQIKNIYNVKDYGAVGDGSTDDTFAIQNAIDDCYINGGGEVYFPNGVYRLDSVSTRNGQTNHLFIPLSKSIPEAKTIRLVGEGSSTYKMYLNFSSSKDAKTPRMYGACLFSTYLPQDVELTTPIAVIGSEPNPEYATFMNETRVYVERLNIIVALGANNYPLLSGINAIRLAHFHMRDVSITSDSAASILAAPTENHVSFGFAGCNNLCDPPQGIEDTNICGGFKYGIIAGEHLYCKGVDIQTCINGFTFCKAYHPNYLTLVSCHNCKNQISSLDKAIDILAVGDSYIKVEMLDIEVNKGVAPTAFNYSCGITDPNNKLHGEVTYLMVNGVGSESIPHGTYNNFWSVNGANGVIIKTLNIEEQ